MKNCLVCLTCVLSFLMTGIGSSQAGVISELTTVTGPAAGIPSLPVSVATVFVDNDENPTQINFVQLFTSLQITGTSGPVVFELLASDSGTGGTTEYTLNQWIANASGAPWASLRYTLSAKSTSGNPLVVPGLDFDWPDKTTLGLGSTNFTNVGHQPLEQSWGSGVAGAGANEITTFALDVPDIGEDYVIMLTLDVPEPVSVVSWFAGLVLLGRQRLHSATC